MNDRGRPFRPPPRTSQQTEDENAGKGTYYRAFPHDAYLPHSTLCMVKIAETALCCGFRLLRRHPTLSVAGYSPFKVVPQLLVELAVEHPSAKQIQKTGQQRHVRPTSGRVRPR